MKIPKGINQKHDDELFKRIFKPLDNGIDEHGHYIKPTYENYIKEIVNRLFRYIHQCKISDFKRNNRFYLTDDFRKALLEKPYETIVDLITSGTGMGKTFLSLVFAKYLRKIKDINVVYLCQQYLNGVDQVEEDIKKLEYLDDMVIYRSKDNACSQKAHLINGNDTIGDFIKQGFAIKFYCDEECPDKDDCKAVKSHDKLFVQEYKSFVGVQNQINAVLPNYFKTFPSSRIILFIDEDMESALEMTKEINKNTLNNNINYLIYEIRNENRRKESNTEYIEYLNCLKETLTILKEGIDDDENNINYDQLDSLFSEFGFFGIKYKGGKGGFLNKLKNNLQFNIKENRYNSGIFNQIYNLIIDLVQNYDIENNDKYYPNFIPLKWIKTAIKKKADRENRDESLIDINFINKANTINFNENEQILKIIHNDATADKRILQAFYGENQQIVQHFGSKLDYEKIKFLWFQILKKDGSGELSQYGKTSNKYGIKNDKKTTLGGVLKSLKDVINFYQQKILTIGRNIKAKEFKNEIMRNANIDLKEIVEDISEFIVWDEYPLTGTNIHKDINIIIILIKPELSDHDYKRKAILYHTTPEYYRKYFIEKNIKQAYGRIMRGDDMKTVIIFTGYKLFTEDFIERNNIDITYFESRKALENYFKILKYQEVITKYLKENNTIIISRCMDLLQESYGFTREILYHLEIEEILDHGTSSIGHRHIYFLKE